MAAQKIHFLWPYSQSFWVDYWGRYYAGFRV